MNSHNKVSLLRDKIVFLAIVIFAVLSFTLPFRIVKTFENSIINGNIASTSETEILSGFDIPIVFLSVVFLAGIALMILYSAYKAIKVIALISLLIYLFSIGILYFGLTFNLNFFGPPKTVLAGLGYYILAFLSLIFSIQVILTTRKTWNFKKKENSDRDDLLDHF